MLLSSVYMLVAMAFWDKISSRGDVEDRRSMTPVVGGIGAGGLALYLLANVLLGGRIDVGQVLNQLQTIQSSQPAGDPQQYEGQDSYEVFASTVLGSTNDYWTGQFANKNHSYIRPKLVLFRVATPSECGTATSQVGPHYCPLDQTIYLDETFFDELMSRFGAKGGDVAQAYVIGHEVGHHVQQLQGTLDNATNSIQVELQADCYAGLWAGSIRDQGVLEPGEINEALDAAAAVGDDRIQEKVNGYIEPETWTHGSSQQRLNAFMTGYKSSDLNECKNLR